ncbi:hemolysin family protein [Streptomyces sp. SL13]|uniref:Hemolysin family protein n=1 Tax=Streptantibioticus silvisoli TaxID=2705255 RepID=A0AA90KIN0_9ACTN|nr:hemolysin family protein [Streptantibioticus silvisoli]MDI5973410.1 hemolysin family protein [Streptantibioticus silvisoli]
MTEVLLLLLALALALACGVFVAAEFSLTTVERAELEEAVERGDRGAASAMTAVRSLTFQLSGAQLGITVTGLVIGMLAEPSVARLLSGPLRDAGLGGSADGLALVLGTVLTTVVLMVVGELIPKNWAISRAVPVARAVATPQRVFSAAFKPLIGHLNSAANHIVRRLGMEPAEELASVRSRQELQSLARHSAKEGALSPGTADLVVRTLSLVDLTAQSVMTPRVHVTALPEDASTRDVTDTTRATGLSRFPVYRDTLDTVIGIVHIKDALAVAPERRDVYPVTALMREPLLVPGSLTVDRLLDRMSGDRTMAVVIDEYGGTAGVATLEDIVEEVVGEVRDEHDPQETADLAFAGHDAAGRVLYDADGAARTDQLAGIGLRVTHGPYETLAGVVAERLGRIPRDGDVVEMDGWRLEVTEAAGHRASRLRLAAPAPGTADDDPQHEGGHRFPRGHRSGRGHDTGGEHGLRRHRPDGGHRADGGHRPDPGHRADGEDGR